MSGSEPPQRRVEFERLNWLGKAIFVGGQAARAVDSVLEFVVDQVSTVLADADHAFRQGLDKNVEDAKILEEHPRDGEPR